MRWIGDIDEQVFKAAETDMSSVAETPSAPSREVRAGDLRTPLS
jgi:hypothetical protein